MEHNVVVVVDETPSPSLWATSSSSSIYLAMNAKRGKAKRTFTRLNVLGSALFAHIFLPFEEEKKKSYEWKIYKYMNRWMARWTHRRHHSKKQSIQKKKQTKKIAFVQVQPKAAFRLPCIAPPWTTPATMESTNRPTDRPTTRLAAYLSCSFQCIGLLSSQNLNRASVC